MAASPPVRAARGAEEEDKIFFVVVNNTCIRSLLRLRLFRFRRRRDARPRRRRRRRRPGPPPPAAPRLLGFVPPAGGRPPARLRPSPSVPRGRTPSRRVLAREGGAAGGGGRGGPDDCDRDRDSRPLRSTLDERDDARGPSAPSPFRFRDGSVEGGRWRSDVADRSSPSATSSSIGPRHRRGDPRGGLWARNLLARDPWRHDNAERANKTAGEMSGAGRLVARGTAPSARPSLRDPEVRADHGGGTASTGGWGDSPRVLLDLDP